MSMWQVRLGTFYPQLQHSKKKKEQLELDTIVNRAILTNPIHSMPYKHFTLEQRNELAVLLRAKVKKKEIAVLLDKHRTTIWRERKRGNTNGRYYLKKAKRSAKEKRINANARFKKIKRDGVLRKYVVRRTKEYWSPEQIAGRWNREHKRKHIGKDTIYRYIYSKRKDLVKYLRCQKGKYRRRYGTRIREKHREELKKRRIDQRPEIVNVKARIGDWEGDTMYGKDRKPAILTHLERRSGLVLADKLERATAKLTKERTVNRFREVARDKKQTVTYDNGSEFWEYELVEMKTGMTIYFANPYSSWQRGANENANGLMRQFFPKKMDFAPITQPEIQKAVRLLNSRPRKRFNYLTPHEVFNGKQECCTLE